MLEFSFLILTVDNIMFILFANLIVEKSIFLICIILMNSEVRYCLSIGQTLLFPFL